MKKIRITVSYEGFVQDEMDIMDVKKHLESSMFESTVFIMDQKSHVIARDKNIEINIIKNIADELIFKSWADIFFSETSGNTDRLIPRDDAFEDFRSTSKVYNWSTNKFTGLLKSYCLNSDRLIKLNPTELQNQGERIIKQHKGRTTEMIYVKSLPKSFLS